MFAIRTYGDIPSPRYGHTLVQRRGKLYLFGGTSGCVYYNDLYELDLSMFGLIISGVLNYARFPTVLMCCVVSNPRFGSYFIYLLFFAMGCSIS